MANDGFIVEFALRIDDPAGIDELLLAQALLDFGRAVPAEQRREVAARLRAIVALTKSLQNASPVVDALRDMER